jgi:pSer/pThr/pTyr-binding forkhead associated (FHA) protein
VFVTEDQVTRVRDAGSLNGTYVNRGRIEESALASGDEVQVGKFKLVYLRSAGE